MHRLLLIRFAAQDVIARELVFRALELMIRNRFGLQSLDLRDQLLGHVFG
jgi:hypothetical protein